jgi:hypothetical protein
LELRKPAILLKSDSESLRVIKKKESSMFRKSRVAPLFVLAALLLAVPAAVLAARPAATPPTSHVFGSLESLSSTTAVITTRLGDIDVALDPVTAYVSYDQAAALAGIKDGDQVDASGVYRDGTLHADRLRYDTSPFFVTGAIKFNGHYSASTSSSLTLQLKKKNLITFNTDANTRYFLNGQRVAAESYEANEHVIVWAREYSNQTWLAVVVNAIDHHKK